MRLDVGIFPSSQTSFLEAGPSQDLVTILKMKGRTEVVFNIVRNQSYTERSSVLAISDIDHLADMEPFCLWSTIGLVNERQSDNLSRSWEKRGSQGGWGPTLLGHLSAL